MEVDVTGTEPGKFGASQTGGVEHFEHGAVPKAQRGSDVSRGEHRLDLIDLEDDPWKPIRRLGEFETARRIVGNMLVIEQPSVEDPHRDEVLLLGTRSERCPGSGAMRV